ncbi:MAG: nickel-dependent lactate racemase [Anaerolineae bacterium]|nr:nickel-dependent lactate racemase [Anaerolineae bacterium]
MKSYSLPYGNTELIFDLPDESMVDVISPVDLPPAPNPLDEVRRSLLAPFGKTIKDFSGAASAAIAINDKTRPVPHQHLLPPLLEMLQQIGVPRQSTFLVVASGTHSPMPPSEYSDILPPEIIEKYPVISHNCEDDKMLVYIGNTSRNTPVYINRRYYEADLKIAVGNIEPHHFMGFSGGAKSVSIGLTGRKTITANHSFLTDPRADIGVYEENPMRQDVEEIGDMVGVQFALNAVLNSKKKIAFALAGNPRQVMEKGIEIVRDKCQVTVDTPYDLVIASPGGFPKDINLYQAQKGISHSSAIVRDGGVIILAAACPEGSGSQSFEQFMQGISSCEEVFAKFEREGFKIGPHKAFQIARIASKKHILLISQLPPAMVRGWLMIPQADSHSAIQSAMQLLPNIAKIAIMPRATNTIPRLRKS